MPQRLGKGLVALWIAAILPPFFPALFAAGTPMTSSYLAIDFGTSNCTAGWLDAAGQPQLQTLENGSTYLSSALYLPFPDSYDPEDDSQKKPSIAQLLRQPEQAVLGLQAHQRYSADPLGGLFIRSPKSMLGSRLNAQQSQLYQQICQLMLSAIRQRAAKDSDAVLIGRPIHFQGIDGNDGDERAEQLLRQAAQNAGFRQIAFAYEPLAAAVEYEKTLTEEQRVLVVDIGGGTTDLSLCRLGPQHAGKADRSADLLSHSGRRLGGVDMDIKLAIYGLMPLLGRGSAATNGRPLPAALFSDAVNIIDIQAQEQFYQSSTAKELDRLSALAAEPEKLRLLQTLYQQHLSYYLVQQAEQAKIALSSTTATDVSLERLQHGLNCLLDRELLAHALYVEMNGLRQLIDSCLTDAAVKPDAVFLTGGASSADGIKQVLRQLLPTVPLIEGDSFGSVGKGLCRLAALHFN